jgi:hypothetical protein
MITQAMLNDIEDIEIDGIDTRDYPDFCDAYICSASWKSTGQELTDAELQDKHPDFVYEKVMKHLY